MPPNNSNPPLFPEQLTLLEYCDLRAQQNIPTKIATIEHYLKVLNAIHDHKTIRIETLNDHPDLKYLYERENFKII